MSWATPITWTSGQVVGASDLNAQIRDNMNFLLSQKAFATIMYFRGAGNYTLSGNQATLVAMDTTNLRFSASSVTGRVRGLWGFGISADNGGHNGRWWFSTILDGATNDQGTNNGRASNAGGPWSQAWVTVPFDFTSLAVSSHTYDLAWRNDSSASSSATIFSSATLAITGELEEF